MRPLHVCCSRGLYAPTELLLEYQADYTQQCDVRLPFDRMHLHECLHSFVATRRDTLHSIMPA